MVTHNLISIYITRDIERSLLGDEDVDECGDDDGF